MVSLQLGALPEEAAMWIAEKALGCKLTFNDSIREWQYMDANHYCFQLREKNNGSLVAYGALHLVLLFENELDQYLAAGKANQFYSTEGHTPTMKVIPRLDAN